jgi:hypothetical protein
MGDKVPYIPFYTGDWLKDPKLSMCSPATRGIWVDAVCAMHESDRSGSLTGTPDQLARVLRCTPSDLHPAIAELISTGAADVREHNGFVTLINRRMKREYEHRKKAAERQRSHRLRENKGREVDKINHANDSDVPTNVTPESRERNALYSYSYSISNFEKEKLKKKKSGVPNDFLITDAMLEWAKPFEIENLTQETEKFLDYHRSKSSQFNDWIAAWRNWIRNSVKFKQNRPAAVAKNIPEKGKYEHLYES